jgi:hypothetical protein
VKEFPKRGDGIRMLQSARPVRRPVSKILDHASFGNKRVTHELSKRRFVNP